MQHEGNESLNELDQESSPVTNTINGHPVSNNADPISGSSDPVPVDPVTVQATETTEMQEDLSQQSPVSYDYLTFPIAVSFFLGILVGIIEFHIFSRRWFT